MGDGSEGSWFPKRTGVSKLRANLKPHRRRQASSTSNERETATISITLNGGMEDGTTGMDTLDDDLARIENAWSESGGSGEIGVVLRTEDGDIPMRVFPGESVQ